MKKAFPINGLKFVKGNKITIEEAIQQKKAIVSFFFCGF